MISVDTEKAFDQIPYPLILIKKKMLYQVGTN